MAVLFAVTWIMGRQAWHMYPSCSVHWVMQAEMQHISHVFWWSQAFFFLSPFSPPLSFPLLLTSLTWVSTGIAVDKNGLIYFVDGTTIRKVDQNGIISTFLGSNDLTSARPLTCDNSMDINQVTWKAAVPDGCVLSTQTACSCRVCHSATLCPHLSNLLSVWSLKLCCITAL